jgi:1,4-alpha-glucan branching enzyme
LGLKYYRITGKTEHKEPYIPSLGELKAAEDAADFVGRRIRQAYLLRETFAAQPPLVVSPYDAELYGHWWSEGPQFLDFMFRELRYKNTQVRAITPGDFLDQKIPIQIQQPSASSWGANGYYKVWLNEGNSWMYPYQHDAERRMTLLANRFDNPDELTRRTLNQIARELLLAQSSDWAFQIYQGTTVEYSSRRFRSHIHRFNLLAEQIEIGVINEELLTEIESRDNIFQEIDYRFYRNANS